MSKEGKGAQRSCKAFFPWSAGAASPTSVDRLWIDPQMPIESKAAPHRTFGRTPMVVQGRSKCPNQGPRRTFACQMSLDKLAAVVRFVRLIYG